MALLESRGYLKGVVLGKKFYEFIDLSLKRKLEKELEDRKSKIHKYYKICVRCGQLKMRSAFSREKRNTDGKLGVCKTCKSRESLKYYYENKKAILAKVKKYQKANPRDRSSYFENYRELNKKRLKKIAKAWYKENKKMIKKRNLKYYEDNKEHCQAIRKIWIEEHKEEIKKYNREYQKLKNNERR